jgi:hypothetical protein
MSIVGRHPETGVRIEVERESADCPPWYYTGEAVTPDASYPVKAEVDADGNVSVELGGDAPHGLADKVRFILRTAWKHASDEEPAAAPPRRIVRWRAER